MSGISTAQTDTLPAGQGTGQSTESTDIVLGFKGRFNFAIGDLGYNMMYYWVSTYLMIFYTDVFGISMYAVSMLMLVVRVFDAVNDPIIGALADRTKQRTGTYRKWIQWGGFGLGVSCILLFWAHPAWNDGLKIGYMYVTYIVLVCMSTAANMPYGVLTGTLTTNTLERTKLSELRMFMVMVANMAVVAASDVILRFFAGPENNGVRSYLLTMGIFVVVAVPTLWRTAFTCKEVVKIPEKQKPASAQERVKSITTRPMLATIMANFSHGWVYYGRAAVFPYYFTYVCGNPALIVSYGVITGIAGIVGCLLAPHLHKLFKSKGKANGVNMTVMAVATGLIFWFSPVSSPVMFYLLSWIGGMCLGVDLVMLYSMIPDAIDFSYCKTGVNVSGFLYAICSFGIKVGGALAPALIALVLGGLGYVANVAQTSVVLTGINFFMSIGTGIFCLLTALFFALNNVDDKKYNEIKKEIVRRQQAEIA